MKADECKVLSLFCGCGGLCEGFKQAGFQISVSNDIWEPALDSYRLNHPTVNVVGGDIRDQKVCQAIYDFFGTSGCDVIIGGPPCQAYSMSGRRDENDPRGKLFHDYVGMVDHMRPKVFVMENVTGILSMKHGKQLVTDMIHDMFAKLGYDVRHQVLNSADYGVPQFRRRVIFIGVRSDLGLKYDYPIPEFGEAPLKPFITAKQAIDHWKDVPDDKETFHLRMKHCAAFVEKIKQTKAGDCVTGYSESFARLAADEPSKTCKANNGSVFLHYEQDRTITPREMAALQSFADTYRFVGSKHDVLVQICNAVPPLLGKAIAESVKCALV